MARIYCMCRASDVVKQSDGTLALTSQGQDGELQGTALPEYQMDVDEGSVSQFIVDDSDLKRILKPGSGIHHKPLRIREHFPNVDIYECKDCLCRIAFAGASS